jgi:NADH-quinone oxidoreductase subunit L
MSEPFIHTLMVLVPALPLLAVIVTAALGPRVLRDKSHWPSILGVAGSCLAALALLYAVWEAAAAARAAGSTFGYETTTTLWSWAVVDAAMAGRDFQVDVTLRADPLTALMLAMVTFVSLLVVIYSAGYMHGDAGYWRFFTYMPLFVFSMTMLVSVSNFVLLYVFWEAVGACSYLLIGFWYQKPEAAAAGKKAFLVNRVGDFGFAVAVFLIWSTFATLDFHDSRQIVQVGDQTAQVINQGVLGQTYLRGGYVDLPGENKLPAGVALAIGLLLFLGACGKSAQFPLHVWLPDAMEGPTPVSALIHAATMVTAGVYLVARCAPLYLAIDLPSAHYVVAAVGGFTALLAALIALTQTDLKRILAYSTVSQLGYMFLGLGTMTAAGLTAGMFHLFTHAFFKALLFLAAGSVMHALGGVIDLTRFSGLRGKLPVTHLTFLIGCLALGGVFPLAGFWSKDAILGAVADQADGDAAWLYRPLYYLALITSGLTAFYSFRAFFRAFYGPERIPEEAGLHAHESPRVMTGPLIILALCALLAGAGQLVLPDFLGLAPSLAYVHAREAAAESHFHWGVAAASTLAAVLGIGVAAMLYLRGGAVVQRLTVLMRGLFVYQLSRDKFYFDEIYSAFVVWPLRVLAYACRFFDDYVVDQLVNFFGWLPRWVGATLRPLQIGLVQFYALAMVLGLLVLIGSLFRWN